MKKILPGNTTKNLLTIQQVATYLEISTKTLRRWEAKGIITPARTIGNQRRYTLEDIRELKGKALSGKQEGEKTLIPSPLTLHPKLERVPFSQKSYEINDSSESAEAILNTKYLIRNTKPKFFASALGFAGFVILISIIIASGINPNMLEAVKGISKKLNTNTVSNQDLSSTLPASPEVLAYLTKLSTLEGIAIFNIPVNIGNSLTVTGDITAEGSLTAPNVVYSITAGQNITVSGDTQNPTISIENVVTTLQGETGDLELIEGDGITIDGLEIGLTDTSLTITAGTGLSGGGPVELGGSVTLANAGVISITGTANQVIASSPTGAVTLSLPQDIALSSSPTFATINLTDDTDQIVLGTGNTGTITLETLTDDRTYTLPDTSGSFCLTSGNCAGLGGIIGGSGTTNRIAKFVTSSTIGNSSINDLGSSVFVTIDATGQVGIGDTTPSYALDVTGDINNTGVYRSNGTAGVARTCTASEALTGFTSLGGITTAGTCGAVASTLQANYNADADGSDVIIELTTADDSLIFRNPATGGTDSGYLMRFDQLNTGAVAGVQISQSGTSNAFEVHDDGTFTDSTPFVIDASGNVGIGDATPSSLLEVGNGTDSLQISSVGDLLFVDADGGASITGPAGGALSIAAANSQALNLTTTTAGNISLDPAGAGDINLVTDNTVGSNLNISGLAVGTGNALCVDGSLNVVTCTVGSGGISGSGTAGQIAFFNGTSSITSETSGFGWDAGTDTLTVIGTTNINTSGSNATNIGTGTGAGTITIGNTSTGDLALNDAQWSITGAGAATFASVNSVTGYSFNGTPGATTTCSGSTFMRDQVTQGGIVTGGTCANGTSTLQSAYDNGNTITTTTARDIEITLAEAATDTTFEITQAGTDGALAFRVNDDGTFTDTTAFVIDQAGNVGIGDTSPSALLEVGNGTDSIQISTVGDITFVDADGGASITGPAGGALTISAANSQALNLTTTTAGNISLDPAGAGDITLVADNASSSFLNIAGLTSAAGTALCIDGSSNVYTCSAGSGSDTLQSAYNNDADGSDAIIALTTADDSLIFRNPASGGTDSTFVLEVENLETGNTDAAFKAFYTTSSGSFNTTSASITNYGGYFSNTSTESAGANTLTNVGLYATASGADNNYAAIFEAGNVGIGDTTPSSKLEIGDGTDSIQISTVGDITFVDADGGASITGPAGGALSIAAANSQALNLTTTTAGNISLDPAGAGDITLVADNASSSFLNIAGLTSAAGTALCIDGSSNVYTCSAGSGSDTLQSAYNNDADSPNDAIIPLTTADDSLIFRNPATGGTDSTFVLEVENLETGNTDAAFKALYTTTSGSFNTTSASITNYGGYFSNTSTESAGANTLTNVGLYATASGADNNYAAIFEAGNVGIGDTTPTALLTVGNGDLFQVSSAGQALFNGVATDITTTSGEHLTLLAGGVGEIILNDTVQVSTLGSASTDTIVCRNSSSQLATCLSTFATQGFVTLQNAYNNGNTIETASNVPVLITETTTGAQTGDLLQLTSQVATGGTHSGDLLQLTLDAVDADGFTGNGIHLLVDQSQNTGNLLLFEQDTLEDIFVLSEIGAITQTYTGTSTAATITADSLTSGSILSLTSASTAATGNTQKGLNVSLSGTNATSAQTTYGGYFSNTHAGTTSTNVGLYSTATGGTTANYAAIFEAGNVGIGTTTPNSLLHLSSTGAGGLFKITDTTSTAQDVLTIADGGATTFRNQTNSTTALQILNATTGTNLLRADTTNMTISLPAFAGGWHVDVIGHPSVTLTKVGTHADGKTYIYIVTAISETGETAGTTTTVTAARDDLDASNYIEISWVAIPGAKYYHVYRVFSDSTVSPENTSGRLTSSSGTTSLSFNDTGVATTATGTQIDTSVADLSNAIGIGLSGLSGTGENSIMDHLDVNGRINSRWHSYYTDFFGDIDSLSATTPNIWQGLRITATPGTGGTCTGGIDPAVVTGEWTTTALGATTGTNTSCALDFNNSANFIASNMPVLETRTYFNSAPTDGFVGFSARNAATAGLPTNTVAFRCRSGTNSGNWEAVVSNAGGSTSVATSTSCTVAHTLRIEYGGDTADTSKFYIDGTLQTAIDASAPPTGGIDLDFYIEPADTATVIQRIDYIKIWVDDPPEGSVSTQPNAPSSEPEYDPSQGADLAEAYATDDASIWYGDIVQLDPAKPGFITKSSLPYSPNNLGVISTYVDGKFILGQSSAKTRPVALSGRVPVKIASTSASIKAGDYITSSDEPGKGMKATKAGVMVGKALEDWSADSGKDSILIFVSTSYADPNNALGSLSFDESGNLILPTISDPETEVASLGGDPNANPTPPSPKKDLGWNLADIVRRLTNLESGIRNQESVASGSAELSGIRNQESGIRNLTDKVASLEANLSLLTTNYSLLTTLASTSAELGLDSTDASISGTLSVGGRTTLADVGITGKITAGLLAIEGLDASGFATINTTSGPLKLQSDGFNGLDILGGLIVIDTSGNMKVTGEITAKKLNIDTEDVAGTSLGTVTIPAGQTNIDVATSALTPKSKIFITPEKPVAIGAKAKDDDTINIKLELPQTTDLKVNWWIIN